MVNSCEAVNADVGHGIPLHHDAIANDADDSRPEQGYKKAIEKLTSEKAQCRQKTGSQG